MNSACLIGCGNSHGRYSGVHPIRHTGTPKWNGSWQGKAAAISGVRHRGSPFGREAQRLLQNAALFFKDPYSLAVVGVFFPCLTSKIAEGDVVDGGSEFRQRNFAFGVAVRRTFEEAGFLRHCMLGSVLRVVAHPKRLDITAYDTLRERGSGAENNERAKKCFHVIDPVRGGRCLLRGGKCKRDTNS